MGIKIIVSLSSILFCFQVTLAQTDSISNDSLSKFDKFNKKMEALFKIIPVPIIKYDQESGNTIGLAKFNAFHPVKADTISKPSKIAAAVTLSSSGRVNISISNDLILKENKYMILSIFNYRKQPEYILGIGNDVVVEDAEEIITDRIKFETHALIRVGSDLYAGIIIGIEDYTNVETDSTSFLIEEQVTGLNGGTDFGLGGAIVLDSRDNRYNSTNGMLVAASMTFYEESLGSRYDYNRFNLDIRKYFNPWLKHVVALQATTTSVSGDVPFYNLALLGGEDKMRGYYKGALRDNVLFDTQVEYRMPVWNIFGVVGWVGTGRVAEKYKDLSADGFWITYGAGLRIKVDSQENINLRIDVGYGNNGINGVYFNFAEAF